MSSWCLFHLEKRTQLSDLSESDAQRIVAGLRRDEHSDWVAWREGWQSWLPLKDCPELRSSSRRPRATPPPPPPMPAPKSLRKSERRAYKRVDMKLVVVMNTGNVSFRTHTENVSLGGLLLERAVPQAFLSEECVIHIASPDMTEKLEFTGRVAVGYENPRRISFVNRNAKSLARLERWLRAATDDKLAA